MTDVRVHFDGSMVGFLPVTPEAEAWFYDNVESEEWQWLGPVLWVDQHMAGDIVAGMEEAGLETEEA